LDRGLTGILLIKVIVYFNGVDDIDGSANYRVVHELVQPLVNGSKTKKSSL
jgi:hypothetical protein